MKSALPPSNVMQRLPPPASPSHWASATGSSPTDTRCLLTACNPATSTLHDQATNPAAPIQPPSPSCTCATPSSPTALKSFPPPDTHCSLLPRPLLYRAPSLLEALPQLPSPGPSPLARTLPLPTAALPLTLALGLPAAGPTPTLCSEARADGGSPPPPPAPAAASPCCWL